MSLVGGHLLAKFKMSQTGALAHRALLLNVNDRSFTFVRFRFDSLNMIHFFIIYVTVYSLFTLFLMNGRL